MLASLSDIFGLEPYMDQGSRALDLANQFLDAYDNNNDDAPLKALASKYGITERFVLAGLLRYYAAHAA